MGATRQRDHAATLAKSNPRQALELARKVTEPWFRAQALAWAARYAVDDPVAIAAEAARAARAGDDAYKQTAVRAWEIAALAERGCLTEARKSLREALAQANSVTPASSRSEALMLLLQAAFKIGRDEASEAHETLRALCAPDGHWRCQRALRESTKMLSGEMPAREFFW